MLRRAQVDATLISAGSFLARAWRSRASRLVESGFAVIAILIAALSAPHRAFGDISQVDVGTFTNTNGTQATDTTFTVSPGANVLVIDLNWRSGTRTNNTNLPIVTYNGQALTLGALAADSNANFANSAVYYLFNPTAGTNAVHVDYGTAIAGGASAFDVFTLGGVDTNQSPNAYAGRSGFAVNDGGPSTLSVSMSNYAYGSWVAGSTNYRLGTQGLLTADNTFPATAGTLITNGFQGSPTNGNLWASDLPTTAGAVTEGAGALVSNITQISSFQLREVGAGPSVRFTMGAVAFAPIQTAPSAPVSTWNGGSGTTSNWSDGANWGGTAPAIGNALSFAGAVRTSPINDTPAGTTYGGIGFAAGAAAFNVSGNDITLQGDIVNNSSNTQTIGLNVALNGGVQFTGGGGNPNSYVNAATGNIVLAGSLSGSQGIVANGPGTVTLGAANTYSGTTRVLNGTLRVNNANGLQNSELNVLTNGSVGFGPGVGTFNLSGGLSGNGHVSVTDSNSQPVTLVVPSNGSNTAFAGSISGSGGLKINTSGVVSLTGTNTYSGPTVIQSGTLKASVAYRYYRFTVNSVNNNSAANSVQMSELQLFGPNSTATPLEPVSAFDPDDNQPGEVAPNLADQLLTTKWLNFNKTGPGAAVTYDYGTPQVLTKYNIATANDARERDPTGWTISASNDGVNFTNLDVESNIADPVARQVWYIDQTTGSNPTSFFNMALAANTPLSSIPSTSAVVMSSNTTLDISNGALTIGSLADATGNPTGHQVLLGSGTLTTGNDGTNTTFSGAILGTGGIAKIGGGIFTLAGASTYTGATTVSNGTLRLASTSSLGNTAITVGSGAKLQPRPLTGATITTGGSLALSDSSTFDMGSDGNAGRLSVAGGLTLGNNVTLNFDIGTSGGTTVTDVLAAGGAAVGSGTATINITGFGATNLAFGRYSLVTAGGGGLTTESFLLANTTVVVNGTTYGLSLIPGPGAEQLRVAAPANNGTWIQTGSGTFSWGTPGNWQSGLIPGAAGDIANFGSATANNETINLDQNRSLGLLTISNGGGGNYTFAGNGFTLTLDGSGAGALVTNSTGNNIISAPVNINDAALISAGAGTSLNFSGVVSSTGGQSVTFGSGGSGTIVLSNTNTFTGGVTIAGGRVSVATVNNASTNGPLGNQTSVTLGAAGENVGTLEYTGGNASSNMPFITATGGGGSVQVDTAAAVLTLSGSITGSGSFGTSGPGTVALTSAGNNFSGGLNLNNGTLRAANANSGVIGSGNVTFGASNTPTLDLNGNSPTTGFLSGTGSNGLVTNGAASGVSTLTLSNSGTATFAGSINKGATADVGLAVTGGGTQVLTGVSNFTGGVAVQNGTLQIGAGSLAPNDVTLGSGTNSGTLVLGDGPVNLTIKSLTVSGTGTSNAVVGGATAVSNLTIANTSPQVYPGTLFGGPGPNQNNLSITAGGTSSVTLSGNNTYNGGSTVSPGATLVVAPASYGNKPIGTGAVTLTGGTLNLAGTPNGNGLVGSFYISPPANVNNADPAFNDLPTMTAHFAGGTPRVSVATTTGGKTNLDFSNNAYGGGAPFNGPNDTTTAAYGFPNNSNYETTFTGYLNIVTAGSYTISTTSDDGSVAFIDGGDGTGPNGLPFVNNNMYQGPVKITSNAVNLTAGLHALTVGYYQGGGGQGLLVEYNGPDTGGADATIPNSALMLANTAFISSQSYANALTVTANSTLNITNSLAATMGNATLGAAALNVTSSDATANPYSLTLGTTTLTGNATINVANSTGGGAGTVTLGSVNGAFSLSKGGPGTVVLSTVGSYSGGTTVSAGTVQANTPGSLGAGPVTLNNGSTLKLIANPSTVAPVVGFGGGANWTVNNINNTSTPFTGDVLTLTDGNGGEVRSAFYNSRVPIVYGNHGFTASFTYQDVNPPAGGGADGVTFTLHNDLRGPTAIGGGGGGLGYGADASPALIAPSVAYEINIYNGHQQGSNFVNYTTNPGTNNFIGTGGIAFQGGDPINVVLAYDPVAQTITETDTDTVNPALYVHVYNVGDLTSSATGVGGTDAFIGITGATGGVSSTQTVTNFNYSIGTATASEDLIVSPAATATIDVTPTGSGSTVTMGSLTIGAGGTLNKTNSGTLAVTGPTNLGTGAAIHVNAGGMKFTNGAGNSAIASGASATVAAGATLELAGTVSNLSDPGAASHRVHVSNNSTAASGGGLLVSGSNQQVGAIDGTGDTFVNDAASLTADHIVQGVLAIGTAGVSASRVTIASSDASGNPLAIAGSLAGDGPFGAGGQGSGNLSDAASGSADSGLGSAAGSGGAASSVPEPSTVVLTILGALACLARFIRRRRMTK
jgi:autotransporter-associated beta strand protein